MINIQVGHQADSHSAPSRAEKGLLKVADVAAMTGLSKTTIYRLVERGVLKPNRVLRHLLFKRTEIQAFIGEVS